ncbi:MAG: BMP family ABC transporter substrate-binding protein [Chloroflexi bacterium]|nr:BMP family ABC transporter substrate-binding protein [Chloroflexota bacterium]
MRVRVLSVVVALPLLALVLLHCAEPKPAPRLQATEEYKLAAIFPGVITDGDYNALGYIAVTTVQSRLDIETAFSQQTREDELEDLVQEYIATGYNIIFVHGAQFLDATQKLAWRHPNVAFIGEGEETIENPPPNLWIIDRNFHLGFYVLGALGAWQSRTGRVAYVGGMPLPGGFSEVHAIEQAIEDQETNVALDVIWLNDFNDPVKAHRLGRVLMAEGVDVLFGSLNLGMLGLFEAAKTSPTPVWITAKYTDKSAFAPNNYLTSVEYDFATPLTDIVTRIMAGERGGRYPLELGEHISIPQPRRVSPQVWRQVEAIIEGIRSGAIVVRENTTPIR